MILRRFYIKGQSCMDRDKKDELGRWSSVEVPLAPRGPIRICPIMRLVCVQNLMLLQLPQDGINFF